MIYQKNISCGKTISYADDTTLIVTGSNIDDVRNNLDTSLKDCVEWFNNNRLVINTSITNTMVITNNVQLRNLENNPLVMIDDKYIPRVPELKILCILIDESLSWNAHIKYLCSKVNPKIALLHRLRQFLAQDTLNTLYITLKACLHYARFLAQSLWTRPPMMFGKSCSILRARSCMQDCAYTLQDVKVIKCLVI